jgi:hypothetical protein
MQTTTRETMAERGGANLQTIRTTRDNDMLTYIVGVRRCFTGLLSRCCQDCSIYHFLTIIINGVHIIMPISPASIRIGKWVHTGIF